IGLVGEVEAVNTEAIRLLTDSGVVPVIAPVGVGSGGETYKINADLVARDLAAAPRGAELIHLTDVQGVLDGQPGLRRNPNPEGRRAPHKGRRDRRRHAAEGRVVAPGPGGRHRQGPHHRRKPGARDPARALHAGRHRNGDRSVRSTAMDTKTLLEWSAKYHT